MYRPQPPEPCWIRHMGIAPTRANDTRNRGARNPHPRPGIIRIRHCTHLPRLIRPREIGFDIGQKLCSHRLA